MLIITLCILYIFCAVFSRGVHSHPRVNVHCVLQLLAQLPFSTSLCSFLVFVLHDARTPTELGGLQRCKYLKECHFNFMLEVERAVSASGIFGRVFIPVCCEACARARVKQLPRSPYHHLTHLLPSKTEHTPSTHPPNFSCLMSHHQRQIQPQLLIPFSLHGFLALC